MVSANGNPFWIQSWLTLAPVELHPEAPVPTSHPTLLQPPLLYASWLQRLRTPHWLVAALSFVYQRTQGVPGAGFGAPHWVVTCPASSMNGKRFVAPAEVPHAPMARALRVARSIWDASR